MTRICLIVLGICILLGTSGCGSFTFFRRNRDPQLSKADPPLSPNSSSEEILARVNENAYSEFSPDGLRSYRCDDVRVRMQGVPAAMRASIVVEAPRNLRLRVANPISGGEAVDIGSNEQEFWFWAKDSKPANVLVCSHDQIAAATQVTSLPLPFRPDWLMEVLGVAPISGVDYEVRRTKAKNPIVELVSVQHTPDQQPVRRFVKINTMYGVVLEHRVESMEGQMIARAVLSRHFRDPATRLILARQIAIDWPAAEQQLALSLEFQNVEFNSPTESVAMWSAPKMPDYPTFDIGQYAARQLGQGELDSSSHRLKNESIKIRLEDDADLSAESLAEDTQAEQGMSQHDPPSLDLAERIIRTASDQKESPLESFNAPISEQETEQEFDHEFPQESPLESPSSEARPFPKSF